MTGQPAVLIMGPTASGKSAVALALAERFDAEIVSVDSAQVYRGMDIGTAKPDLSMRVRVPHHLIDVIEPVESYSAARFRADALDAIDAIRARGRLPLVVGGTMLYFKALREGLSRLPSADAALRAVLDARAAREGWPALHAELAKLDAPTAARLATTDGQRIQRALEVHALAGAPLSRLVAERAADRDPGPTIACALIPADRSRLHATIARRFDAMIERGLVEELGALRARYALAPQMPSMRCVGYRQAWSYLDGDVDFATFRARAVAATRQLAKRQFTWLRATDATRFDAQSPTVADAVSRWIEGSTRR
jgi:tRNA dimethylallyltransferase